jgi:hypothetical protein
LATTRRRSEAYAAVKSDVPLMAKIPLLSRKQLMQRAAQLGLSPTVEAGTAGARAEGAEGRACASAFRTLAGCSTAASAHFCCLNVQHSKVS